ncbi:PEP-CTERM sorting domain-containing protein [Cylindrospermum sp. FACHB-282]|uniref:PEP-CTERM sorting domain-containing protein n=1 Tax=Cylindrospermum sp. FACHB-282 TaxID=2692794 RepID=UPI001684830A|nr:PEP-CTERM sorting domain-containing protein [Cylindrospermum sp. FACHB-282]MBD2384784.1 PEP-CTERM sorting domain-containing protein [Cylindrospermum sp. FACHB-282]
MTELTLTKNLLLAGIGATFLFAPSPSQAAVINLDNFTGWQTTGNVYLTTNGAVLYTDNGTSQNVVESFLGLGSGTLNTLNTNPTNGSAIKNTITVQANDVLTFNWKFQTSDYLPYNDFSFYSIASSAYQLADVAQVGNYGQTTSQTSYTFQQGGTYTIGFGVFNARDYSVSSNLIIGDVNSAGNPDYPPEVPEPLTMLGSLTAAGFGVILRRKRALAQKDTAKA